MLFMVSDRLDSSLMVSKVIIAASYIMHDDMEMAESELSKGNSAFHKVISSYDSRTLVTFSIT
jgi:hypothetical protein